MIEDDVLGAFLLVLLNVVYFGNDIKSERALILCHLWVPS